MQGHGVTRTQCWLGKTERRSRQAAPNRKLCCLAFAEAHVGIRLHMFLVVVAFAAAACFKESLLRTIPIENYGDDAGASKRKGMLVLCWFSAAVQLLPSTVLLPLSQR